MMIETKIPIQVTIEIRNELMIINSQDGIFNHMHFNIPHDIADYLDFVYRDFAEEKDDRFTEDALELKKECLKKLIRK